MLNQFRNLRSIKASDNYIQEVNLTLQKLEDLDLHNNYIRKFPVLHSLPKITRLNLNTNKISDFRVEFKPPSSLSLQHLDIGSNQLQFDSTEQQKFVEKLKKLKNLKSLVISNNPFSTSADAKIEQIASHLYNLEWLNHEKASIFKQVSNEEKKVEIHQAKKKTDKNTLYFPTLEGICYTIEAANIHPSFALDHLKDLAFDVDRITEYLDLIDEYFGKGKEDTELVRNEMIENFMQNAQILIDNHYELQNIMLSILAKLSIVRFRNFGFRCFNTLKDLMKAGKDMEDKVVEVLKKEVINKLQQQNPEKIPAPLLKGLHELVNETQKAEMLSGLFENGFPSWFRMLRLLVQKKMNFNNEDNEHYDSIVALMAVSVKNNPHNVRKAIEKELVPIIAEIVVYTSQESNRYINSLKIVQYMAEQSEEAANLFIDLSYGSTVEQNIIKNIKNAMLIYKKNNDLREENSKETDDKIKTKYLILAAEIDCLGGFLNSSKEKRESFYKEHKDLNSQLLSTVDDLLSITAHYKTDPVLLTAICNFARKLFSLPEVKANQTLLEPRVKRMQSLVQLTPYLGLKKYELLLKLSRTYYDKGAFADKEKATQLQHLDDVVIQKLFIAIIKLINFFCEEAEKPQSCPIFEEVSQSLNDANREQALFNCLLVPNDDVKLAVVECLNNVPLSEFDNEEISTIIRLVGSYKNIGAGQTELVLSMIFWILSKLAKEKVFKIGKDFRGKYGDKAISEALDLLTRNLQRSLEDEDEEQEKLTLSLSLLHFLKFASQSSELKNKLLYKHDAFKEALYAEQENTSLAFMKYPIELEETWLGRTIDVLLASLTGNDSLDPYNYVSFRILQRMADLLMNRLDSDIFDPFQAGVDVILELKKHYQKKLKQRKKQERSFWQDPIDDFLEKMQKNQDNYKLYVQQHYYFTQNNGIPLMRLFLTKKVPEYEAYLKNKYSPAYEKKNLRLRQTLMTLKDKYEHKEKQKQQEEEERKGKAVLNQRKRPLDDYRDDGLNILKMVLQQEELGQNFDPESIHDEFSVEASKKTSNVENINKRDHMIGVQNLKMRSLCISAYLRCLFAAIEYAPNLELRFEAIRNLKSEFFFRSLTQLCDTTGWFEANIGAKYLRIMRQVIALPSEESEENQENLMYYEMLAVVIRKILNQLIVKIKNEQQVPLSNEDKILIYELAATCNIMCQQCSLFRWSSLEVKQQGSHMRTRRTPQEKLIDKQISTLFPSAQIHALITIIFRDMNLAYKIFDEDRKGLADKEEDIIKLKGDLTREEIKQFLGEYLSRCKENKYEVLECIMKGVVFEKKLLRDSFLQEILLALQNSSYKNAIEHYIFDNSFGFVPQERERIIIIDWVEMCIDAQTNFKPKLLALTNKGFHIFRASSSKPCTVCPKESLCPEGPKPELKIKYGQIIELITFPNLEQKLVVKFQVGSTSGKKDQIVSISMIIPSTTSSKKITAYLKEIQQLDNENQDHLTFPAIRQQMGVEEEIVFAKYISYRPSKGILGLWGDDGIIPNCTLLALSDKYLILLKENWGKWYQVDDPDKIEIILKRGVTESASSMAQKQLEQKMKGALQGLFTEVLKRNMYEIKNLHVHRGREAVVELQFGPKVEKLIFLSDLCRQQFIEALTKIKLRGRYYNNIKNPNEAAAQ